MDDFSGESFATTNSDGSVTLDAYAGMSRDDLKVRCRKLSRAVGSWQMIAMVVAEEGIEALASHDRERLQLLIEAYKD